MMMAMMNDCICVAAVVCRWTNASCVCVCVCVKVKTGTQINQCCAYANFKTVANGLAWREVRNYNCMFVIIMDVVCELMSSCMHNNA